ncbi:MAG: hypothetical protein AB3N07_08245 [Ruegeria sp.]
MTLKLFLEGHPAILGLGGVPAGVQFRFLDLQLPEQLGFELQPVGFRSST